MSEGQRVAKRDQVAGFFCGLNRGDAGNPEHIALCGASRLDQCESRILHFDAPAGDGNPVGWRLAGDVDHVSLALLIKMRQFSHV